MYTRLRQALPVLIGLVLFAVALEVLRTELRAVSWHELTADIVNTSPGRLGLALFLTILNYVVLTGCDFLAFQYIGKRLQTARIALASFLAYAIANNVGFAMLSGTSIRYRFYTRWGVTNEELSRIVFSYSVTFWLGLFALGGFSLAASDLPTAHELPAHELVVLVGWVLMLTSAAYVLVTLVRRAPIRVKNFELPVPQPRIAVAQLVVSLIDWTLASAVLYVLLPPSEISFPALLGAFLAAQLLGLASHVPGGVGVFEGLMVLFLKPFLGSREVLPALVVYRAVYYLLPLTVALVVLVADEVRQRKDQAARVNSALGRLTEQLAPRTLAIFTFLAGLVLLFSGATPVAAGRLALLDRVFPLGVIEVSHFAGSMVGAALLVLSQGIARRVDAAYFFTVVAIGVGMAASLLKGADYEEAALLALLLLVLWRARPAFARRAAFFETRFSLGWTAAVMAAIIASIWLGLFAFKHVEFSNELWWQFELHGEASRFMRASIGASIVLLMFAFARLIGYAPHETIVPEDAALAAVAPVIESQTSTFPYLVYLRDKTVLFDDDKKCFVMYGVQGRTWVALGDPVGPQERMSDLIRLFLERCDDFGGVPVFYQIGKENLHRYADFGLTFVKLGEEARVDLNEFSLDGPQASKYRQVLRRLEKDRATFRVVSKEDVPAIMEQLRAVSDDWLKHKSGAEKGFSLGFFESGYLSRFPVAVIEREGNIQAFANLWPGPKHVELSADLMRYHHEAPRDVMEALFVHLMKWGKEQGYQWFALGMAPLSGFDTSPVAPLWNRLGSFLYAHGESIYHFQGLRAYKEKFKPAWEPHYLAYPGGFKLPRVLADVSAVVAGGYRKVFVK
jgi:phosphatidylglycerol lysyltransferase